MQSEVILPSNKLASFVSGYFLVDIDNRDEEISLRTYESGPSLGIPLGKPFLYYAGRALDEFEEVPFEIFDKPLLFWDSKSIECLSVKGNARVLFIVFTDLGLEILLNEKKPDYKDPIFPLSRLGVPIFNLIVRRKLRLNRDDQSALQLVEQELIRFFRRHDIEESHQAEVDLDLEDNGDFPVIP
ncbi:hypothetical protein [Cecembia calidifontis]|jgi:hypothetical protein|uniref:Uncharacterized protein n=1 Tax=Cecembia calidifontis TaxID=1187080 RepID=A0A4Q7PF44_9BACT|nr:hypothetical protein [Cecembia calidifontis]RZS97472.1 hypothetical protein BC751_3079 [Cecembia calidifontis]